LSPARVRAALRFADIAAATVVSVATMDGAAAAVGQREAVGGEIHK